MGGGEIALQDLPADAMATRMGRFVRIGALAWMLAGGVLFTLNADETPMEPTKRSESADAEPVSPDPATPTKPLLPQLEDLAWTKGSYRIVPYGIGWLNVAFDTARTTPGPFALYVASRADEGEPQFSLNEQSTRFGLDVSGLQVRTFATSGRIEFDFHGHALFENRASVLMRHAYGELKNDNWRILGGLFEGR